MSEPVSSATVLAGGLMGASVFGLATNIARIRLDFIAGYRVTQLQ
ncbi:hypothetical protein ACK85N_004700 [Salmonella enterica]